jgi:hypothetical protein
VLIDLQYFVLLASAVVYQVPRFTRFMDFLTFLLTFAPLRCCCDVIPCPIPLAFVALMVFVCLCCVSSGDWCSWP